MIGKIVNGKYKVIEKLGAGGSGEVYKAYHIHLGTPWALKMISSREEYADNEFEILKNLIHPAFPRLVDVIEEGGQPIMVFDYYEGPTLLKVIEEEGKIEEGKVSAWAAQILDALLYLHRNAPEPIIYRDLKPSNLIVLPDNSIKLIDFGTARLFKHKNSDDTIYLGTPGYAAPEQYGSGQTDVRTDIYNFGMTLFHLLTGRHPLHCNEMQMEQVLMDADVSKAFRTIILKCIVKDPEERFYDIDEVKNAFRHYLHPSNPTPGPKPIGKNAVEISVSGMQRGVGVTHFCLLFGIWLQIQGFKTAVLEYGENGDTLSLCKLVEKENQVLKHGFFQIKGLSIYPSMGKEKIDCFKRADFDYILLDYGVHDEYTTAMMRRSDVKLVMAPGADWKMGQLGLFLKKYESLIKESNTYLSFPLQDQKSIHVIQSYFRLSNMITIPFVANPWKMEHGVKTEIGKIYGKIFQENPGRRNHHKRGKELWRF